MAQLEARYEEMRRQMETPARKWPCDCCRWKEGSFCRQPFIIGLDRKLMWNYDYRPQHPDNALCGPEKALWEPIGRMKLADHWIYERPWLLAAVVVVVVAISIVALI